MMVGTFFPSVSTILAIVRSWLGGIHHSFGANHTLDVQLKISTFSFRLSAHYYRRILKLAFGLSRVLYAAMNQPSGVLRARRLS